MDKKKLNRKSYFCNDEVANYIKTRSEEIGVSESAFINICIDSYMSQRIAINTMSNLEDIINKLELLNQTNDIDK
ncbi:Uncharacterised protein [uncultured Clostridium sp.]|uniref:hypothetical protein n=1 Tax=uncultured Clostridium sp. TaxID=59620 RepID=UPI0008207A89|nr:hypothetical protein [uncultured Clostridium sp.]SCK04752.1 Uncharacterised protein [uncultured Clostridium sp.]